MYVFSHSAQKSQKNPGISPDFLMDRAYISFFSVYAQKALEFWAYQKKILSYAQAAKTKD